MPGPVSDSFDPEWGSSVVASQIDQALAMMYRCVTDILDGAEPIDIRRLVDADLPRQIAVSLSERDWRLLRFALERARESL